MTDDSQILAISNWLDSGSINIFGLPFAGKDDQASRLEKLLGGARLGGGDILRSSMTPEIKSYLDRGKLIPSELYVEVVLPYLSQKELQGKPLILSSVGRWLGEEVGVMEALEEASHPLKAVIFLDVSPEDALKRLHHSKTLKDRGDRDDDDEKLLMTRFEEFENKTLPVIERYRELGLLIEIDATQSREAVRDSIIEKLAERAASQ